MKDNKKRISTIWRFAKPHLPLFIISEICIVVTYAVALVLPLNLTRLTDRVLYGGQTSMLPIVIRDYIILFLISLVFNLIYAYTWQTLSNKFVVDVKNKLFEKTMYSKAQTFFNMDSGDIMSRIDGDADQFIYVVQRNLFHIINSIILCVGIILIVASINLQIAAIIFLGALLPIVFTKISGKFSENYSRKLRSETGGFFGKLFEVLKGMREIKLLCAEWWAKNSIFKGLKNIVNIGNDLRKVEFFVDKVTYLINLIVSIIIYSFSVYLIVNGKFTIGLFLAVIQYLALIHKKFNWILRIYLDWRTRKVSIDRVNDIFDNESENSEGDPLDGEIESIEFCNVSFSYDKNTVLDDVSFSIKAGEHVAIVGVSGVGKTTITELLLKFFTPHSGTILINGKNIENILSSDIRRNIGLVRQDIKIFEETVRFNLLLGNNDCTDDELRQVCEKVALLDLVKQFPKGFDTVIGGNAEKISGGQKQRLMIARALLKNSNTFILDEATSALDVETESLVVDEFKKIRSSSTLIVISHRLNTIKHCDKIIVIKNGKVEMIGSHDNLIKESKLYQDMFSEGSVAV